MKYVANLNFWILFLILVRLRLKMAFRTLAEYNDLREEALKSLNPRPQCVRKLYILVKKHYHPSA